MQFLQSYERHIYTGCYYAQIPQTYITNPYNIFLSRKFQNKESPILNLLDKKEKNQHIIT